MSFPRAFSSRFVCNTCRGVSSSFSARPSHKALKYTSFSTSVRCADKQGSPAADPDFTFLETPASEPVQQFQQDVPTETLESTSESAPPAQPVAIPWYLKQQSSAPSQPTAEIPALPPNPPPILETILEYVSVTAGLDDLELLDLRELDPPPALGPKLIMIIATARSEKHLHVSADRFARWLRREHGLKANAAGLLGRNELKIKLRRKAKRMRMLANVGGTMPEGNIDDGIRTGWICCTLSKVEAHPNDTHMPGDDVKEFIGFREVKPGVNIVVQMFTEEKRNETDLETLWGGVVRTHERRNKTADETLKEVEQDLKELEEDLDMDEDEPRARRTNPEVSKPSVKEATTPLQFRKPRATAGDPFPSSTELPSKRQVRRLHTIGL